MTEYRVKLHGGDYDGLIADASPHSIRHGAIVLGDCPRHGGPEICGCDEQLICAYFDEPGKGSGYFELLIGSADEDLSRLDHLDADSRAETIAWLDQAKALMQDAKKNLTQEDWERYLEFVDVTVRHLRSCLPPSD